MQFPKHGKSELPYSRKSIGRHKHPKAMGFSRISQDMIKPDSHSKGKTWKNKNVKFKGFLHISDKTDIHVIPKPWED